VVYFLRAYLLVLKWFYRKIFRRDWDASGVSS